MKFSICTLNYYSSERGIANTYQLPCAKADPLIYQSLRNLQTKILVGKATPN